MFKISIDRLKPAYLEVIEPNESSSNQPPAQAPVENSVVNQPPQTSNQPSRRNPARHVRIPARYR